jgi:hypothetical protein
MSRTHTTTEIELFAQCLKHSVNLGKHSAKVDTRQRKLGELYIGDDFFSEYFLSVTRQRLYRVLQITRQRKIVVTAAGNGDRTFTSVLDNTRQRVSFLSSAQRTSTRQRGHQRVHLSVPLPSALGVTR